MWQLFLLPPQLNSELHVTICSNCHPFYTGAQKFLDTAGRIEKFQKRYKKGAKAA